MSGSSDTLAVMPLSQTAARDALAAQPIVDMHTHLYPPTFGTPVPNSSGKTDAAGMMLWGVDELVTYHYLVAEVYRVVPPSKLPYEQFWKMSKAEQADHIWKHLFVERTPVSEACRGVMTSLTRLGLDPSDKSLAAARKWTGQQDPGKQIDRVMELSKVKSITMTNAVFDDNERNRWLADPKVGSDPRFTAVLRIDPMLREWPRAAGLLSKWDYPAAEKLDAKSVESARKFLRDWIDRMKAIYLAVSLPPAWRYPAPPTDPVAQAGQSVLEQVVLPVCAERNLPFAMMIGSNLRVNPALREAGDMVGYADVDSVANLCRAFAGNRFFVTMLARENQHALCVAARKFANLMLFGCWWFINNPSLIDEVTRMRVELLGTSFIPQHSDARVLEQLIYKWEHSRALIANVMTDKYADMATAGRAVTEAEIKRDAKLFFEGNFANFLTG
jgi:hypothetical protein